MADEAKKLRPYEGWTINYARKMIADGRITREQAQTFVNMFRDGLTIEELYRIEKLK